MNLGYFKNILSNGLVAITNLNSEDQWISDIYVYQSFINGDWCDSLVTYCGDEFLPTIEKCERFAKQYSK